MLQRMREKTELLRLLFCRSCHWPQYVSLILQDKFVADTPCLAQTPALVLVTVRPQEPNLTLLDKAHDHVDKVQPLQQFVADTPYAYTNPSGTVLAHYGGVALLNPGYTSYAVRTLLAGTQMEYGLTMYLDSAQCTTMLDSAIPLETSGRYEKYIRIRNVFPLVTLLQVSCGSHYLGATPAPVTVSDIAGCMAACNTATAPGSTCTAMEYALTTAEAPTDQPNTRGLCYVCVT